MTCLLAPFILFEKKIGIYAIGIYAKIGTRKDYSFRFMLTLRRCAKTTVNSECKESRNTSPTRCNIVKFIT